MIAGWVCAVCGRRIDIATPLPWRCPAATSDDPHHVLRLVERTVTGEATSAVIPPRTGAPTFRRYAERFAWRAFARANGMTPAACDALVPQIADDLVVTPLARSDRLSDECGVEVWVKDETGNLAGSHKARHLASILLHLRAAELLGLLGERPPLAIASCGNAALAAATLARRAAWPLDVYVPTWMDDAFGDRLDELGARIHRCERRSSDPPGDPAMLRFREARDAGAIPFTVQGPENALCLDAGRTIGWEIADQAAAAGVTFDRAVVQVGGGAMAACLGAGVGPATRLDAVQAEGAAPFVDAWDRIVSTDRPERYWSVIMRPWTDPHSLADGIVDDETYDWIALKDAMFASGGRPVAASEDEIAHAHRMATAAGYSASPTGSAGVAGVLALARAGALSDGERVVVVMSGVAR